MNAVDPDSGRTVLHLAVESAELFAVVEALISRGAATIQYVRNESGPLIPVTSPSTSVTGRALVASSESVHAELEH